jgi:hypothetical protein
MRVAHIDLSARISVAEEQLVVLVEALSAHCVEQHALVRNPYLAKRLAVCGGVSVGPIVRSAVFAYFLMPVVDLVHMHDRKAVNCGTLHNLARSIPYVVTYRQFGLPGDNPLTRSKYRRAEAIVCPSEEITTAMADYAGNTSVNTIGDACNAGNEVDATNGRISAERMAAEYLRVYRRILDSRGVPAMLL